MRSTWGSRPTLQMDALPCGSAWKWVIPALQPVYGLRHPQPRALAAERNWRSDKAPAVNAAAGSQDSTQPPRRLFEQACLPLLDVIDPDRQPPVP